MVEMQQQALVSIEKSQPEKVVVYKRSPGPHHDIQEAEPAMTLFHRHLRPERRIAVHMLDVVGHCGIGIVYQRML